MDRNGRIDELSAILARHNKLKFIDVQGLRKSFDDQEDLTFEDFLIDQGLITKGDLLQALSEYYGVPALDVIGEFFDHYLLRLFPKDILLLHYFIPYAREADHLTIVAAEPDDPHLPVVIGEYISHDISFMVGLGNDIHETIEEFYDRSNTYQPNGIENELMERSGIEVHPTGEERHPYGDVNETIPLIIEETRDDYESD
jgi:Type II secretion system (T2SS), protein E, N-terminal domain